MKSRAAILTFASLLAACELPAPDSGSSTAAAPEAPAAVTAQALEAPEGLVADGPLFQLDVQTREHVVPVRGSRERLSGVLADAAGRRALRWIGARGDASELAPSDWNLPPAGATNGAGDALACWSLLTGDDEAGMPHPAQGMALHCRLRTRAGLGPVIRLSPDAKAAWLQTVVALRDGSFRVVYNVDDGWLLGDPQEGHGIWAQQVSADGVGRPALLRAATPPM